MILGAGGGGGTGRDEVIRIEQRYCSFSRVYARVRTMTVITRPRDDVNTIRDDIQTLRDEYAR